MQKHHIKLRRKERDYLESLVAKGKMSAKLFKRATGLLELDRGKTLQAVAETLGVSNDTVAAWRENYKVHGLQCLEDAPRSGRPCAATVRKSVSVRVSYNNTSSCAPRHSCPI